MIRFTLRQVAATMILAAAAALTPTFAGEAAAPQAAPAPAGQPQFDAPPPKPYVIPAKAKDYLRHAVELPTRPLAMTIHDAYRKPVEVLALSGVKPGSRVIELSSYGNYWSAILSDIVGEKGELHMYDMPFAAPLIDMGKAFVAKHPNTRFENVDHNVVEFPKGVDVVTCMMCFHELLLMNVQMDGFLAKLYKAMKPGSTFLVVFSTARDGMQNKDTGTLHRVDPATIRGTITSAGFVLYEESRLLENHDDDKKSRVFTETETDLSDRLIYRFRR